MQQVLVQIIDAAHPDLAEDATNRVRVPWLEERTADNPFRERPDPRIFGSHLPPDMLPQGVKAKQLKVIYNLQYSSYQFKHPSVARFTKYIYTLIFCFPLGCVCLEESQGYPGVPLSLCPQFRDVGNTSEL